MQYKVYRKPLQINVVIRNKSNHSPQHKITAYKAFLHLMFEIPVSHTKTPNKHYTLNKKRQWIGS